MVTRPSFTAAAISSSWKTGYDFTNSPAKTTTGAYKVEVVGEGYQGGGRFGTCVAHLFLGKTFFSFVLILSVSLFAFFPLTIFALSLLSITPIAFNSTVIGTIRMTSPATLADMEKSLAPSAGNAQ